jgi:hypothetical protein
MTIFRACGVALPPRSTSARRLRAASIVLAVAVILSALPGDRARAGQGGSVEVQVSKADGFSYGELAPAQPIVMFPVSSRVANVEQARRLSETLGREAKETQFIEPAAVASMIRTEFLGSAFDSLVTTMSTIQPASSFTVLSAVAGRFAARHALVPINVAIDRADAHYAIDMMFILVDLRSGQPRLIMSAGDAIDGQQASNRTQRDELEAQTIRAVLHALREPAG